MSGSKLTNFFFTQEPKNLFTPQHDVCLLAPGPFPDEDGGLGPDPGAHGDARAEHGEQVDLLHHEAGTVLDGAFWDRLVGLRGNRHVGFAPVETYEEMISMICPQRHMYL